MASSGTAQALTGTLSTRPEVASRVVLAMPGGAIPSPQVIVTTRTAGVKPLRLLVWPTSTRVYETRGEPPNDRLGPPTASRSPTWSPTKQESTLEGGGVGDIPLVVGVELRGLEPLTSAVQRRCSPS